MIDQPGGVAVILEAGPAARLRLVGVDRECLVVASARMRDMINAAAQRSPAPGIDDVEGQRRMRRRPSDAAPTASFQALKRTPATNSPGRPVERSGTRRPLQVTTWRLSFKPSTLTCRRSTEESTKRDRAAGRALFAQHMPRLERVAQFELHAAMLDRAVEREAELPLRVEPDRIEVVAGAR